MQLVLEPDAGAKKLPGGGAPGYVIMYCTMGQVFMVTHSVLNRGTGVTASPPELVGRHRTGTARST